MYCALICYDTIFHLIVRMFIHVMFHPRHIGLKFLRLINELVELMVH